MSDARTGPIEFTLELDADGDPEESDLGVAALSYEITESLFGSVSAAPVVDGEVPPGARPIDPVTAGLIAVQVIADVAALAEVIKLAIDWAEKRKRRKIVLQDSHGNRIEIHGTSQQDTLALAQRLYDSHGR